MSLPLSKPDVPSTADTGLDRFEQGLPPEAVAPRPPEGGFSEGSGRYPRRKSRFRVSDAAAGAACLYSKFTVLSGGTVAELAPGQDPRPRPRFSLLTSLPAGKAPGLVSPGLLDQAGIRAGPGSRSAPDPPLSHSPRSSGPDRPRSRCYLAVPE